MIFLSSMMFVVAVYVVPGFWVLGWLASRLPLPMMPEQVRFGLLAGVVYLACLAMVYFGRWGYLDLQMDRGKSRVHPWFDARGCAWLTLAGVLVIGLQFSYMSARWAMPMTFVPLYAALLAGFIDLRRRPALTLPAEELPKVLFPKNDDKDGSGPVEGERRSELVWEYLAKGSSTEMHMFTFEISIAEADIDTAAEIQKTPPQQPQDYVRYVKHGPMDAVRSVAAMIRRESEARGYVPLQEVEMVIHLVRAIPYRPDAELPCGGDHPQFPVVTLAEQAGDCEAHAILAASLLWQLGHKVGLFFLRLEETAHMALAYRTEAFRGSYSQTGPDGETYTYIETTPTNTELGEVPDEFLYSLKRSLILVI